jgi:hypothetical protein
MVIFITLKCSWHGENTSQQGLHNLFTRYNGNVFHKLVSELDVKLNRLYMNTDSKTLEEISGGRYRPRSGG